MSNPKVGDYPVKLRCNLGSDISTATTKTIRLRKPLGSTVDKTASFTTDGTDGMIEWSTTGPDDLDQAGIWQIEPYIKDAAPTFEYRGQTKTFTVDAKLA